MRSPRLLLRKQPPSVDRTDAKAGAKAAGTATPDPNSSQGAAQRPLLMRRYRSLLPKGPGRLIVLIADDPLDPELLSYLKVMARDRVHLISLRRPAGSPAASGQVTLHHADGAAEITAVVKTLGAVDLVIVLTPAGGEEHAELWEQLFFAVNAGGAYIVHRDAVVDSGGPDGLLARLVETVALQTNTEVDTDPEAVTDLTSLKIEIAQSAGRLVFDRAFFIVAKRYRHHLKVREAVANDVLPAHGSDISLRVLATLTAGTFASTATVTSHQSTLPVDNLETTISYPELHLREYTGRVGLVAQGLLVTDDLALPDSFRWHQQPDPRNPAAINANPDYLRVKVNDLPSETMAGTYYLLDNSFYGHFGHLMTEVVSKLWGWDLAKAEFPDLKAIYRTRYNWERERLAGRRLFQAYGIAEDDIVRADESVWVERMIGATPMWHNAPPHYAHPGIAAVWDRLTEGIKPVPYDGARKIFVSRQSDLKKRPCRNEGEVEALFAANGFDVVYPELLDLPAQAGLFRDAEVVAGFGGSALFNILYCQHLQTLIVINHESYTARNEHLYALLKGADIHYFWSDPDINHPADGWTEEAFRSPWEFDVERNREPLTELLRHLG